VDQCDPVLQAAASSNSQTASGSISHQTEPPDSLRGP
jgi:cyclic lactone autoinducer peptide